jgi:hypothetical protein
MMLRFIPFAAEYTHDGVVVEGVFLFLFLTKERLVLMMQAAEFLLEEISLT